MGARAVRRAGWARAAARAAPARCPPWSLRRIRDAYGLPREEDRAEGRLACIYFSGKQKGKQRVASTLRFRKFPGKTEGVWCSILETREFLGTIAARSIS